MRYGAAPVGKHDLSSLRVLGSVGEPINPEAWRWYHSVVGKGRCVVLVLLIIGCVVVGVGKGRCVVLVLLIIRCVVVGVGKGWCVVIMAFDYACIAVVMLMQARSSNVM